MSVPSASAGVFRRYVKFCIVGASSFSINLGCAYLLKWALRIDETNPSDFWPLQLVLAIAFVISAVNGYVWNRIWTFRSHEPRKFRQFLAFVTVAVGGLLINNAVVSALTQGLKWKLLFAILPATVLVSIWNFTGNSLWTFRGPPSQIRE